MSVYIIRHGDTEWSLSRKHTGRTEIPLTAHGDDQAREIGRTLHGIQFSRILTSPRLRAVRTAELAALNGVLEIDQDLAEWDYGDYEGLLTVDIRKARPDWNLFQHGCPAGESPAQVSDRADRVVARLREMTGEVAVISHGHFGRALAARWIGLTVRQAASFLLTTASVGILGYEHGRRDEPVIALWNQTLGP